MAGPVPCVLLPQVDAYIWKASGHVLSSQSQRIRGQRKSAWSLVRADSQPRMTRKQNRFLGDEAVLSLASGQQVTCYGDGSRSGR